MHAPRVSRVCPEGVHNFMKCYIQMPACDNTAHDALCLLQPNTGDPHK